MSTRAFSAFRTRAHMHACLTWEPDIGEKHVSLTYTAVEADSDNNYAEQDDYTMDKILAQRPGA